ncbi:MAG TPA: 50S ribosomal protein L23 [Candidatus Saccharimonadales bacterium]|nr:50S ribosomal protein L23 [Candidatus Saccharimonadales bacterium]
MESKTLVLKPRLSEKTYGLSETGNVYVFVVPGDATKHTVARAVEVQFEVTVLTVNMVNVKGKVKRTVKKGGRAVSGARSDTKKAYVTLKAGDKLPFFESIKEEEQKAEETEKKLAKAAEKAAKKEGKK